MGVYQEAPASPGMHWQQYERWSGGYPQHAGHYPPNPGMMPPTPLPDNISDNGHSFVGQSWYSAPLQPNYPLRESTNNNNTIENKVGYECHTPHNPPSTPPSIQRSATPNRPVSPPRSPPSSTCSSSGINNSKLNCHSPSGPASSDDSVICAGCRDRIVDRFYLLAVEQRWHGSCLKCSQCSVLLETEGTCFAREGVIYCKEDYYRLFGLKRCSRCESPVASHELVMRAKDYVFHTHCFSCVTCQVPLLKGDHFGMRDHNLYCAAHYETRTDDVPVPSSSTSPPPVPIPITPTPQQTATMFTECGGPSPSVIFNPDVAKMQFFNGVRGNQKGRPRMRKRAKDLEALTMNLDLNDDSYLDPSNFGSGSGMSSSQSQRAKRMRTSFKHHQLRTMKSYFSINHNPDAKDLKQLSQKTGLPKRVLQVWFQNARAKWRRMMLKTDGKCPEKVEESTSLEELAQQNVLNPQFIPSGMQPTPITREEQSPPYFMDSDDQHGVGSHET